MKDASTASFALFIILLFTASAHPIFCANKRYNLTLLTNGALIVRKK